VLKTAANGANPLTSKSSLFHWLTNWLSGNEMPHIEKLKNENSPWRRLVDYNVKSEIQGQKRVQTT
jgi:hypothetical protein